jgi:radical SAM enzyme (TIGR01210 family)
MAYREMFYQGQSVPFKDHIKLFRATLKAIMSDETPPHTLMIFNGGSFLAMDMHLQKEILETAITYPSIRRIVVESRAQLITDETIEWIVKILNSKDKHFTIRIGIETQDDYLRLKILKKGHTRKQLEKAVSIMRKYGVERGGYVLLNPAPGLEPLWAVEESKKTIEFILGNESGQLGMNEVYFCSTNIGQNSLLALYWKEGKFWPASLWMVLKVLLLTAGKYRGRVYLLPFKDEPPFLAIPSNHVPEGIREDLQGARGCDLIFYEMFENYRQSMDSDCLTPPQCECRPEWF